jgi:hypothetical protein
MAEAYTGDSWSEVRIARLKLLGQGARKLLKAGLVFPQFQQPIRAQLFLSVATFTIRAVFIICNTKVQFRFFQDQQHQIL